MVVSAVSNTTTGSSVVTSPKKSTLDYNSFLKLLVAEMKNQDPTNPTDTAKYISELASFSSVEQGVNTNKKLDSLMTAVQLSQAQSLIGRKLSDQSGTELGIIKGIEIGDTTSIAILNNGNRVELGAGNSIS